MEHYCGVRSYRVRQDCQRCLDAEFPRDCEHCRCGCFEIARFKNPNYSLDGGPTSKGMYNYADWLCADHYDDVIKSNEDGAIYNAD